jgi:hypothetical protein
MQLWPNAERPRSARASDLLLHRELETVRGCQVDVLIDLVAGQAAPIQTPAGSAEPRSTRPATARPHAARRPTRPVGSDRCSHHPRTACAPSSRPPPPVGQRRGTWRPLGSVGDRRHGSMEPSTPWTSKSVRWSRTSRPQGTVARPANHGDRLGVSDRRPESPKHQTHPTSHARWDRTADLVRDACRGRGMASGGTLGRLPRRSPGIQRKA